MFCGSASKIKKQQNRKQRPYLISSMHITECSPQEYATYKLTTNTHQKHHIQYICQHSTHVHIPKYQKYYLTNTQTHIPNITYITSTTHIHNFPVSHHTQTTYYTLHRHTHHITHSLHILYMYHIYTMHTQKLANSLRFTHSLHIYT